MVDPEARRSSQEIPRRPPRAPKRSPREPQNVFKTIFGSKTLIFQKCKDSLIKPTFLNVGGSVWEFKIDPKRFREGIKRAKDDPRTFPRPPSAARSKQTRPKRVPRRIWRLFLVDLEAPKSSQEPPQEFPKGARDNPKTLPKPSLDRKRWFFKHVNVP